MDQKPTYEQLEQRIRELEKGQKAPEAIQNIISSTMDAIAILDENYRYVIVNDAYESFSGVDREKFIGLTVSEYLGKEVFEKYIQPNFDKCLQGETANYQEWFECPTLGRRFVDVTYYPFKDGAGQIKGVVANTRDITQQRLAEQTLAEREFFLETLINAIPIPVFYKDSQGRYTGCNQAFEAFFGESRDHMIGKTVFDLSPPDLAAIYHAKDNALLENGGVQQYESQVKDKQGQYRDVQFDKSVYTDSRGKTIGLIGTILDLTERKRMEKSHQESKARLKALSDAAFEAIFLSEEGICLDLNQTAERMFGYTREEALGRHGREWIAADDRERVSENMRLQRVDPYEVTALRKDGTTFPCEIQARMIDLPNRPIRITALRDITQRKQAEAIQHQAEHRFRKVFENAGMGIAIADWNGRIEQCNPAYCRFLGYKEQELHQIKLESLIHPEDRDANLVMLDRLRSGKLGSFEIENRYLHKKGHPVWVHKFVSVLPDKMGQPIHLMVLVDDITQSKKTKALLLNLNRSLAERTQLAEKRAEDIQRLALELSGAQDRERKRIAAVLHDDFQQTLAYIKLKLVNPHVGPGLESNLNAILPVIDGCIQNCRDLANELSPLIIEQKGFFGALKWLCGQMKEMHGLDVNLQTAHDPEIKPNELASTLIRCIRELLFNVVKHSGQMEASVNVQRDGKIAAITVKDAGRGCDYKRVGQKQLRGSAFGLFNIEDRIKLLGGDMQVHSHVGRGFQVTLNIPCAIISEPEKRPIRVLLADDHKVMRKGLAKLLKSEADMEIVGIAADGKEAVELAVQVKPDVIIMDIGMPVMDGIDATKQVKEILPDMAVIGLTMHTDPDIQQAMLDAGSFACLAKSDSADKLVDTVRSLPLNRS